jgi:hypothetical protein
VGTNVEGNGNTDNETTMREKELAEMEKRTRR